MSNNQANLTEWYTVTEIRNHKVTHATTYKFVTRAMAIEHATAVRDSKYVPCIPGTTFVIEHSSGTVTDVIR